ncbi:hypothetical protein Purlil1_3120 [Purpureocillium lilacinum]|uniref:Uncharacterized protein n=1 Tax=Purpureocillium lilacinum TaxID=33203 RepID=A0ABR0C8J1_PURLI|nr:hypothetical protein Purlil1_3120 [Purpureocillium lilacinum]
MMFVGAVSSVDAVCLQERRLRWGHIRPPDPASSDLFFSTGGTAEAGIHPLTTPRRQGQEGGVRRHQSFRRDRFSKRLPFLLSVRSLAVPCHSTTWGCPLLSLSARFLGSGEQTEIPGLLAGTEPGATQHPLARPMAKPVRRSSSAESPIINRRGRRGLRATDPETDRLSPSASALVARGLCGFLTGASSLDKSSRPPTTCLAKKAKTVPAVLRCVAGNARAPSQRPPAPQQAIAHLALQQLLGNCTWRLDDPPLRLNRSSLFVPAHKGGSSIRALRCVARLPHLRYRSAGRASMRLNGPTLRRAAPRRAMKSSRAPDNAVSFLSRILARVKVGRAGAGPVGGAEPRGRRRLVLSLRGYETASLDWLLVAHRGLSCVARLVVHSTVTANPAEIGATPPRGLASAPSNDWMLSPLSPSSSTGHGNEDQQ